jgi:GNAT superfamily N-acetyltransferase
MSFSTSIARVTEYYRRHGLAATLQRAGVGAKRALWTRRMVVFYCDLRERTPHPMAPPVTCSVRRIRSLAELGPDRFQEITNFWNPKLAQRNVRKRFERGASLWLVESNNQLAGFGWTLEGNAIEPYYFPLGGNDVHFFDFFVVPRFRGRGLNPYLITYILSHLVPSCSGRAYIEAAEWNRAQLSSLAKTSFHCLGSVAKHKIFGQILLRWSPAQFVGRVQDGSGRNARTVIAVRSNE